VSLFTIARDNQCQARLRGESVRPCCRVQSPSARLRFCFLPNVLDSQCSLVVPEKLMMASKSSLGLFNRLTATIPELAELLQSGQVKSVQLIESYLDQIDKHNDYYKAVIAKVPREKLFEQARKLDEERARGALRGPLHGIPILVKVPCKCHERSMRAATDDS
jgi:hypothetical protein